jgi:hypothetical protein
MLAGGGLSGQTGEQLAQALEVTPKAASQAADRARRKLAAAVKRGLVGWTLNRRARLRAGNA